MMFDLLAAENASITRLLLVVTVYTLPTAFALTTLLTYGLPDC